MRFSAAYCRPGLRSLERRQRQVQRHVRPALDRCLGFRLAAEDQRLSRRFFLPKRQADAQQGRCVCVLDLPSCRAASPCFAGTPGCCPVSPDACRRKPDLLIPPDVRLHVGLLVVREEAQRHGLLPIDLNRDKPRQDTPGRSFRAETGSSVSRSTQSAAILNTRPSQPCPTSKRRHDARRLAAAAPALVINKDKAALVLRRTGPPHFGELQGRIPHQRAIAEDIQIRPHAPSSASARRPSRVSSS